MRVGCGLRVRRIDGNEYCTSGIMNGRAAGANAARITWAPSARRNPGRRPPASCSRSTGGSSKILGRASRGSSGRPEATGRNPRPTESYLRTKAEPRARPNASMAVPISADLPFGGSGGPRGDPPGPVVLPPRVHREPDGGRLRRRPADRPGPEPFRWAAALWGRQDMARSGRRYPGRGDSGTPSIPAVRPPRAVLVVVLRSSGGGVRRLRRPLFGCPPRRPRRRVRETTPASAAGREGVWPGPVRLRRRGTVPEPRNSVLVRPPILLRGRALGTPRHHRYYARPASRREPRRLSDGEEA